MGTAVSRGQFLREDFRGGRRPVRPPWALAEAAFIDRCTRCGACIDTCPTGIIVKASGAFPRIDFSRGACTFCGACAALCRDHALRRQDGLEPWSHSAAIGDSCLALNRVVCRSCAEACERRAIRFTLQHGTAASPRLDAEACNGCGACVAICPGGAIEIRAAPRAPAS